MKNAIAMVAGLLLGSAMSLLASGCTPSQALRDQQASNAEWQQRTNRQSFATARRDAEWSYCLSNPNVKACQ